MVALFARSHERQLNGFTAPTWHLVTLPESGSLAEQDAWTMAALAFTRDVWNRLEQDLYCAALEREKRGDKVRTASDEQETVDGHIG